MARESVGKVFGDYECLNPCPYVVALAESDSIQYCPVVLDTMHGTTTQFAMGVY